MEADRATRDRAAGVLLGQACGDALGVPYEFATPPGPDEPAEMKGGGLGNFAPGEWSDDTAMAVVIAEVAATGADLRAGEALDAIAAGFLRWYADEPPDIGIQTRAILGEAAARSDGAAAVREVAAAYAESHTHSAGNGALMRTGPVALAHLEDRGAAAEAAGAVAALTHPDPLAVESCVLWTEAVRLAVTREVFDLRAGLELVPEDRRAYWAARIDEAETRPAKTFTPNGFTVTALQAAWAVVVQTPVPSDDPSRHLQDALHAAVRIGDDTDTVAAIAGQLLGARWGAAAVPASWRDAVHGWPGRRAADIEALASRAAGRSS